MDTMLKGIPLEVKTLEKIIKEIIGIDVKDGITFEIISIKDIRLIDKYGGLKVKLIGYKEHLRVPLAIDVTVGDPITPKELILDINACLMMLMLILWLSIKKPL